MKVKNSYIPKYNKEKWKTAERSWKISVVFWMDERLLLLMHKHFYRFSIYLLLREKQKSELEKGL